MGILDGKAGSDISLSTTKDVWTDIDMQRGHFYDEWVTKEDKTDEEDEEYDGSEYQMRWMGSEWVFLLFCLILKYFISEKTRNKQY